jgi:DNA-binding NarL/FixJ family response regulator
LGKEYEQVASSCRTAQAFANVFGGGSMEKGESVLIAARSGPLRDGLARFLVTVHQIETVHQVSAAAPLLETVSECQPALVLLDTSMSDQVPATIEQIKAGWPQIRCLVLADTEQEKQKAQEAGADVAILKGYPADRFYGTIEGLLDEQERLST